MVVDDTPMNLTLMKSIISRWGWKGLFFGGGKAALAFVQTAAPAELPNITFMDFHMPDMDGFETTEALLALCPDMPIVGLTADATPGCRERALQCGMRDVLAKPYQERQLLKACKQHASPAALPASLRRSACRSATLPPTQVSLRRVSLRSGHCSVDKFFSFFFVQLKNVVQVPSNCMPKYCAGHWTVRVFFVLEKKNALTAFQCVLSRCFAVSRCLSLRVVAPQCVSLRFIAGAVVRAVSADTRHPVAVLLALRLNALLPVTGIVRLHPLVTLLHPHRAQVLSVSTDGGGAHDQSAVHRERCARARRGLQQAAPASGWPELQAASREGVLAGDVPQRRRSDACAGPAPREIGGVAVLGTWGGVRQSLRPHCQHHSGEGGVGWCVTPRALCPARHSEQRKFAQMITAILSPFVGSRTIQWGGVLH